MWDSAYDRHNTQELHDLTSSILGFSNNNHLRGVGTHNFGGFRKYFVELLGFILPSYMPLEPFFNHQNAAFLKSFPMVCLKNS